MNAWITGHSQNHHQRQEETSGRGGKARAFGRAEGMAGVREGLIIIIVIDVITFVHLICCRFRSFRRRCSDPTAAV